MNNDPVVLIARDPPSEPPIKLELSVQAALVLYHDLGRLIAYDEKHQAFAIPDFTRQIRDFLRPFVLPRMPADVKLSS